jgi:cytochrome d ubiquinol oxidase subunit II
MVEAWYAILTFMLGMFVVLDGWNIGLGILHHRLGRTDDERREVIRALGASWAWNEVWLIAFGGCLFLSFPAAYAASFSGFYLAFMLVLWCLVLRGLAIELGHTVDDPLWRGVCDWLFRFASVLLALLFGIAAGNLLRGLPLGEHGWFALPFFTDFTPRGEVGLLDWYTATAAAFTLVALAAHGAGYAAVTATGAVRERAARLAPRLWIATVALLAVCTVATIAVRPGFPRALVERPLGWCGFAVILAGVATQLAAGASRRPLLAFAGGSAAIFGVVADGAVGLFPSMLIATSGHDLNAYDLAATRHDLAMALPWWSVATALALGYFAFILRFLWMGRPAATPQSVGPAENAQGRSAT